MTTLEKEERPEDKKMLFQVGRICMKLAGRDAGKKCVVVEEIDNTHVLIDGETRRRKCNMLHLDPTNTVIEIKSGADHETVKAEFSKLGIEIVDTKPKSAAARPRKVRKLKEVVEKPVAKKKETKSTTKESAKEEAPEKLQEEVKQEAPKEEKETSQEAPKEAPEAETQQEVLKEETSAEENKKE